MTLLLPWLLGSLSGVAAAGVITPLYEGALVADGARSFTVELSAGVGTGKDRLKVKTDQAQVIAAEVTADGRIRVTLIPNAVTAPGDLALEVKLRGSRTIDEVVSLPVVPAPTGSLALTLDPPQLAIGEGDVTVRVSPVGGEHLPEGARKVLLSASVGTVSEPVYDGSDWVARYTPPSGLSSSVAAALVATDLTAPEQVVGAAVLPISPRRGEPFAPDSGADSAVVFAPLPDGAGIPSDTDRTAWLYVAGPDGAPTAGALTQGLTVGGPGRTRAEEVGDGWYRVRYQAPALGESWSVNARMGGASDALTGEAVSGLPTLAMSADVDELTGKGQTVTITLRAKDAGGAALPGLKTELQATGATAQSYLQDAGDGSYTQTFWVAAGTEEVLVSATPPVAPSGLPPARVLLWTDFDGLPADGRSTGRVRVIAEDALGLPVPNISVKLAVPMGDGSLPPTAETGKAGIASVDYAAGKAAGTSVLEARAGEVEGRALAWQSAVPIARAGDTATLARVDQWRGATPTLALRTPQPEVVAAPVAAAPAATTATTAAATTAAPTAAAPAATAAPATTAPPDTATTSPGGVFTGGSDLDPMVVLRLGLLNQGLSYTMVAPGATTVPEDTAYAKSLPTGVFGVAASGEFWIGGGDIGLEGRAQAGSYDLGGEVATEDNVNAYLFGVRYRYSLSESVRVYGGLGLSSFHTVFFRYEDSENAESSSPTLVKYPLLGGRTAAGLTWTSGPFTARGEVSVTWVPYPVDRSLGLGLDYAIMDPWLVGVGFDINRRTLDLEVGDDAATLGETRAALTLQGGVRF